MCEHALRRIMY